MTWLSLRLAPEEQLAQALASPNPLVVATFDPAFSAPGSFADAPATTLSGFIERNLLYASSTETLLERLAGDAERRIAALERHLGSAREQYRLRQKEFLSLAESRPGAGKYSDEEIGL
jgi:hypothetical protein